MAELMAWEKKARVKDEGLKKVKAIVQSVSHSSLHHSLATVSAVVPCWQSQLNYHPVSASPTSTIARIFIGIAAHPTTNALTMMLRAGTTLEWSCLRWSPTTTDVLSATHFHFTCNHLG